jgi:hypothetical protein
MEILTNEIIGLKVVNVQVISEDNVKVGERVLNCTFKKLGGAWRSYIYNFSTIERVEDIFKFSGAEPDEIEFIINDNNNELDNIINQGKKLDLIDDRYTVIDLDDGYELLVDKLEYEAFTGKCFDEYSIYQEAKKIIFDYPKHYKARVAYTLGDGEVGYKIYNYKELGAGYPAYYSENNEIEELEKYIRERALQLFQNDFIEIS